MSALWINQKSQIIVIGYLWNRSDYGEHHLRISLENGWILVKASNYDWWSEL